MKKNLLFKLVKDLNLDTCFQCGNSIDNVSELSIEHKIPWLDSENPSELFFNLDNIAFSHLKCNSAAARKPNKLSVEQKRKKWRDNKKRLYTPESRRLKYLNTGH